LELVSSYGLQTGTEPKTAAKLADQAPYGYLIVMCILNKSVMA